jgi:hypothetical protein
MSKVKGILITLLISLLILPIGKTLGQEEEVLPRDPEQQVVTDEEYDVTIQEEEEPMLDESYEYDYNYDYETQLDSLYKATDAMTETDETAIAALFTILAAYSAIFLIFGLGGYIFSSLALQKIGKEMEYPNPVYAWIPIVNLVMVMQLGKQNPWILLTMLIPGINLVATVFLFIALMEITEKRGYQKILAILMFIPLGMFILLYLLAWKPKDVKPISEVPTQPVE